MNVEKLVANYLRNEGLRLVAKTPEDTDDAWVRVRQLAAPQEPNNPAYHLVGYYCQLDCYASADNGQPEASQMADAVARALAVMDQAVHDEGEVTACRVENGGFHLPDTDFRPARERFIVDATVYAHP